MPRRKLPLIVAGWSVRAAAQSARRGGFGVTALDVFQDSDLRAAADVCRRVSNLRELVAAAADLRPSEWLYTGGVENHPAIVAAMEKRHRLLGNDAAALRRVRDPRVLQRVLAESPAPLPEMRWNEPTPGDDRAWLVKRRSSGGGVRIMPYVAGGPLPRGAYLQEFVAGMPCGVSYLAVHGRCLLLGLCRQSHAAVDPARPFLYGGSIGPLALNSVTQSKLVQLGERLAAEFALRGLFGVDLILQPDGSLRTLEVNPRYTASMELLERADGRSFIELHVQACLENSLPSLRTDSERRHGKRIVYVDDALPSVVSSPIVAALQQAVGKSEFPPFADLPAVLSPLPRGEPFCTIFASGDTEREVERGLDAQAARLQAWLSSHTQADGDSVSSRSVPRRRRVANSGS
jgi:uncharacterized protein